MAKPAQICACSVVTVFADGMESCDNAARPRTHQAKLARSLPRRGVSCIIPYHTYIYTYDSTVRYTIPSTIHQPLTSSSRTSWKPRTIQPVRPVATELADSASMFAKVSGDKLNPCRGPGSHLLYILICDHNVWRVPKL